MLAANVHLERLSLFPGTQLAHVTCAKSGVLKLSMLDTRTQYMPDQEIILPPFELKTGRHANEGTQKPYVQQVLFSPDSLYIAVARNDNIAHVYDARFLKKGPLYELPHLSPDEGSEEDNYYGIPKIEWLEDRTRGLSLVSCGADGMGIIHCRLEEKDLTFLCRLCEAMGHEARQRSLRRHSHRQICLICWLVLVGGHLPRGESPSFVRDDDIFQTDGI